MSLNSHPWAESRRWKSAAVSACVAALCTVVWAGAAAAAAPSCLAVSRLHLCCLRKPTPFSSDAQGIVLQSSPRRLEGRGEGSSAESTPCSPGSDGAGRRSVRLCRITMDEEEETSTMWLGNLDPNRVTRRIVYEVAIQVGTVASVCGMAGVGVPPALLPPAPACLLCSKRSPPDPQQKSSLVAFLPLALPPALVPAAAGRPCALRCATNAGQQQGEQGVRLC